VKGDAVVFLPSTHDDVGSALPLVRDQVKLASSFAYPALPLCNSITTPSNAHL
jgi:hypothetical protein